MNPQELNRVYEALQNAHNAGDTKAAEQLAQYARQLEDQTKLDTTPFASSEGGISDKYIHNPLTYGAAGFFGGMAVPEAMSKVANVVTPKPRPTPSAVPSTPSVQSAPAAVSQHPGSLGPGAVKNIQHNIGQVIGNDLHLGLARNPVAGYGLEPDALVITPNGMKGATPAAPKARPSISAMKNAVKNTMQAQHPVPPGRLRGALSGGVAAGSAIDAVQQAREGNILPAAASTLSTLGGVGMASKNPKVALAGGLASLLGIGGRMLFGNKEEEKEPEPPADKNWMWGGKQFAVGGAIQGYSKGKTVELIGRGVEGGLDLAKKLFTPKPTKIVRASEALGPHEGKYLYVTESDRMRSTGGDLGGPGFSRFQLEDPRYAEAQAAWGVGKKGKASEILNINKRFPEDKIIWSPLIGSAEQHRSNQHVFDRLTDEFSRQASMGNLPSDLRQGMNDRLANFSGYQKHKLAGIDVGNPESIKQFGNTFDRRAAIAEVLGGQGMGGRKGLIFDYPGIMQEMTDPMVVGAPTHSVGTRLFSLTGDVAHRPDLHSAFPYILKGEDKGVAFNAVPKELMLGDWMNQVRDFVGREPGRMDLIRGVRGGHGKPNQFISEEFLRKLEEAGHKEGGLAHLAGGGQPIKMFQQLYRGYAGKPGAEQIFASPQKRVAEYYAQKRAAQTGLQPGVEAVQVDPSAGVKYGHALPIDQFNQDVVTTQARKLSPLDVLTPKPNRMTEFELSMAEQIDQMRQAKKAQDARLAEYYRQKAAQHTVEPRPAQDLGRSVAELAESMEARYK